MRRPGPRYAQQPPFFLLPLLLLLIGAALWSAGGGCGISPGVSLQTPEEQKQKVSDRVQFALTAMKRGDMAAADNALDSAVRDLGGSSGAVVAVGRELSRNGNEAAAFRVLDRWSKKPDTAWDPVLWVALSEAERGAGDDVAAGVSEAEAARRAEAILSQIGQETPSHDPSPPNRTLEAAQRFRSAGQYYGETRQGNFNTRKAIEAFREAYRLLPDQPITMNELGYELADKGSTQEDFAEALDLTRRAVAASDDDGFNLDSYGWALFRTGDLAGARRVLRQAADLEPDIPEIRYHLGVVYARLGLKPQAEIEFDNAINLRHSYPDAEREKLHLQQPSMSPP